MSIFMHSSFHQAQISLCDRLYNLKSLYMIDSKSTKKSLPSVSYSHPLIKTLQLCPLQDHSRIIPTYQPITPSHQNRTSSKLLRFTTLTPSNNSTFTAFLNPFHPIIRDLPILSRPIECPHCQCIVNPHSKIQNYSTLTCNLCGANSSIPISESEEYKQSFAFQYQCHSNDKILSKINEGPVQQGKNEKRRVCLVIEASQYIFQKKVHRGIINCLSALSNFDFQLALIFFDSKYVYFIDQQTLEVTKITLSRDEKDPLDGWDCLPMHQETLFRHISQFNEETAQIIQTIMYQAYYIKETALSEVTHLLQKYLPSTCQIKFFITNLNHLGDQYDNQQSNNFFAKIFKEKQNCPENSKKKKQVLQSAKGQWCSLNLGQNMQFYVIAQNTTYQQSISVLGYHVVKAYGMVESGLEQSIYYDLFQNIQIKQMTNIEVNLKVSNCIELVLPEFPAYDLYGKLAVSESSNDGKYRNYKIIIKQCCQITMIPLKFKINNATVCDKPYFQLRYQYPSQQGGMKGIVINGQSLKVYSNTEIGLEWLDDESLFNDHFRKALSKWNGTSFKELKQSLQNEYQQLIRLLKSNYKYDKINFPKTMKHYFLYGFSLIEKIKKSLVNSYFIYKLVNCGLQTFSKLLYYRTYRLQSSQIRNIKSSNGIFERYSIVFMENGEELYMIFSDSSVSDIKEIFGYFDTIPSLAANNYELPQLQTNFKYRNAINVIRSTNCESFLRLKIVDQDSSYFDCFVSPGLYDKNEHVDFLKKAWKSA